MVKVNDNYLKLPGSYLFSTIGKKVAAFSTEHPDKKIIRLGIGDVTQPLAPAIITALHGAVDEMADAATFHGYAPDLGYEFLRNAIAKNDYQDRGCDIAMFGHTHRPYLEEVDGITLLNPGSLSYPRQEGRMPSYMIMDLADDGTTKYHMMFLGD